MIQGNRKGRVRAWSAVLSALLAAGALGACGGSSTHTNAPAATSASKTTPAGGNPGATTTTPGSTSQRASSTIVRASNFASCMRAHGMNLPTPRNSPHGATLDFKGIDTSSARYKAAVHACARELVGSVNVKATKLRGVRAPRIHLGDIRITGLRFKGKLKGIHLKSIHIGNIELPSIPGIQTNGVTVPNVHVNVPAPNLGGQSGGEAPTQPKSGGEPEP